MRNTALAANDTVDGLSSCVAHCRATDVPRLMEGTDGALKLLSRATYQFSHVLILRCKTKVLPNSVSPELPLFVIVPKLAYALRATAITELPTGCRPAIACSDVYHAWRAVFSKRGGIPGMPASEGTSISLARTSNLASNSD